MPTIVEPVSATSPDAAREPGARTGLSVSGGGYRAMLFHLGSFLRHLGDALPAPHARRLELVETPTRLKRLSPQPQERLINWGYAVCDAAVRKHWPRVPAPAPADFPYANMGV